MVALCTLGYDVYILNPVHFSKFPQMLTAWCPGLSVLAVDRLIIRSRLIQTVEFAKDPALLPNVSDLRVRTVFPGEVRGTMFLAVVGDLFACPHTHTHTHISI